MCFLNCWNTWGFPGSCSGFSSLQKVWKLEIPMQAGSGRWDFCNTTPGTASTAVYSVACTLKYYRDLVTVIKNLCPPHPHPSQCSVFYCLSQQWNCTLPTPCAENGWCRKQSKVFGGKWRMENKSRLVLNDYSFFRVPWFGRLPTHWYSLRLPARVCSALWDGTGQNGMEWNGICCGECWSGLSHPGVLDAVLLRLTAAAFYCLPLWEGNLWCPARHPVVGCHITC